MEKARAWAESVHGFNRTFMELKWKSSQASRVKAAQF